jgi:hypothetical protein
VRFWGDFVGNQAVVQTNDQRYLSFALDQIRATVTTLTLNADDIIYTINRSVILVPARPRSRSNSTSTSYYHHRSPGRIVAANITGFEGLATQGELDVVVMNNGTIQADYTVSPPPTILLPGPEMLSMTNPGVCLCRVCRVCRAVDHRDGVRGPNPGRAGQDALHLGLSIGQPHLRALQSH